MSLEIIGAGFGRTGTRSLQIALQEIGFGPCYHMMELFEHPEHAPVWHGAADGAPTDWRALLDGYRAAVDWPACYFWRELMAEFPNAKVLLTERDPESWYNSISRTIFEIIARADAMADDPVRGPQIRMSRYVVRDKTFGGNIDKDHVLAVYKAHNEAVKREVPPEKLLVYDVKEGWEPLCAFLDVPVPDTEFPRTNSAEEFRARMPKD